MYVLVCMWRLQDDVGNKSPLFFFILFSEARSLNQPRTQSSLGENSIIGITYAYLKAELKKSQDKSTIYYHMVSVRTMNLITMNEAG